MFDCQRGDTGGGIQRGSGFRGRLQCRVDFGDRLGKSSQASEQDCPEASGFTEVRPQFESLAEQFGRSFQSVRVRGDQPAAIQRFGIFRIVGWDTGEGFFGVVWSTRDNRETERTEQLMLPFQRQMCELIGRHGESEGGIRFVWSMQSFESLTAQGMQHSDLDRKSVV